MNNCLQPVLDPATLPSPLNPGQPVSLDTRAQVVFNGRPDPVGAGFEFTITATDATVATPVGLSHGEGRYTTVFTPSTTAPTFNVRACLALNDGSALGSDICVTQQVGSPRVAGDCLGTQTDLCPKCGAFGGVNPFSMRVTQTGNVVTMLDVVRPSSGRSPLTAASSPSSHRTTLGASGGGSATSDSMV